MPEKVLKSEDKKIRIIVHPHKVTLGIAVTLDSLQDMDVALDEKYVRCRIGIYKPEFKQMLKEAAQKAWPGIDSKAEDSLGSDYGEMYDRKRDMNFGLAYWDFQVQIDGYNEDRFCNYDFNKRRMQSFLWDLGGS